MLGYKPALGTVSGASHEGPAKHIVLTGGPYGGRGAQGGPVGPIHGALYRGHSLDYESGPAG